MKQKYSGCLIDPIITYVCEKVDDFCASVLYYWLLHADNPIKVHYIYTGQVVLVRGDGEGILIF